jgi:hypothetical protein
MVRYYLGVLSNIIFTLRKNVLTYCGITIKKILPPLLGEEGIPNSDNTQPPVFVIPNHPCQLLVAPAPAPIAAAAAASQRAPPPPEGRAARLMGATTAAMRGGQRRRRWTR